MIEIIPAIVQERLRQQEVYGQNDWYEPDAWITLIAKQLGDASRASINYSNTSPDGHCIDARAGELAREYVQIAALCVAALDQMNVEHPQVELPKN